MVELGMGVCARACGETDKLKARTFVYVRIRGKRAVTGGLCVEAPYGGGLSLQTVPRGKAISRKTQ